MTTPSSPAADEQTLADYAANPYGFTAGMKFKGE